jgi:hypothetical protein
MPQQPRKDNWTRLSEVKAISRREAGGAMIVAEVMLEKVRVANRAAQFVDVVEAPVPHPCFSEAEVESGAGTGILQFAYRAT